MVDTYRHWRVRGRQCKASNPVSFEQQIAHLADGARASKRFSSAHSFSGSSACARLKATSAWRSCASESVASAGLLSSESAMP